MDPFLCDGPTVLSVSGGRSSMMMLRRTLDAHGGRSPRTLGHALSCERSTWAVAA